MKTIAVFFSDPEPLGSPLDKPEYFEAYSDLSAEITHGGACFYLVRGQESYLGQGKFGNSWQYQAGAIKETGPITVDVLYDKGSFLPDPNLRTLNPPEINEICSDKWATYQRFQSYCPKSILVEATDQLKLALESITSDLVVAKPQRGFEGIGVFVGSRSELESSTASLHFPLLVQAFIDSSAGIPGIVAGVHDFRIGVLDGEPLFSYVRTPPKGSLKANFSLGGSYENVAVDRIPLSFLELVGFVDAQLTQYRDRFYSVDLALTPDGPKIIELNSRVGMSTKADLPIFITRLSDKLLSMAQK